MNKLFILTIFIILIGIVLLLSLPKENWFVTSTYTNTPYRQAITPTIIPSLYNYPGYGTPLKFPYTRYSVMPYSGKFLPYFTGPNVPYTPIPLNTWGWNRTGSNVMLTSLKSPKEFQLGQWVRAGVAYTDNPNDPTYVDVYQLNLDPSRDLFSYSIKNKWGQTIPIKPLHPTGGGERLADGDRFTIPGMEGYGDFVFSEADKYSYVYL